MIIKGSQRGSGVNLAVHLMRIDENEHVRLHEIRGFVADNLHDAFKETEAISLGTKCSQYLFSVSVNPPQSESVPAEVFEDTFDRIEKQLGLEDQPRAIVFHEKESRLHAHAVWSRIDAETMTARHLPFFKNRLLNLARDLHLEFGWEMPRGMLNKDKREPTNFSLAEWQQCKRQGVDPRWLKRSIQDCWSGSDSMRAFESSLRERGFYLAKGDRRGHVVVDHTGEVYALSRMLDVRAKDVRARLGEPDKLKSVEDTRKFIGERMTPAYPSSYRGIKRALLRPLNQARRIQSRDDKAASRGPRKTHSKARERMGHGNVGTRQAITERPARSVAPAHGQIQESPQTK